ncbi:MAG: thermonuclease family protein [Clostridia bacterium]|jgi:micrococcal nuclease
MLKNLRQNLVVVFLVGLAFFAGLKGGPWLPSGIIAAQPGNVKDVPRELYSLTRAGLTRSDSADTRRMIPVELVDVVDGDTIKVRFSQEFLAESPALLERENVRMIGFDAPEIRHPTKGEEPGGQEARNGIRELLDGQQLLLAFDRELRDRYDRLLAYVYTAEGLCINLRMVETGLAPALQRYPFNLKEEFAAAEKAARRAGTGIWNN